MASIGEVERIQNVDRFEESLRRILPGDEGTRFAVAQMIGKLPPTSTRRIIAIASCNEFGVREAIPYLRAAFEERGKGLRDVRYPAMLALVVLLEGDEKAAFLVTALEDGDYIIAEGAAIEVGIAADRAIVAPMLEWLVGRLKRPRSKSQSRVTAEIIAVCRRFGDAADLARLDAAVMGIKLAGIERLAVEGAYRGQVLSARFPEIVWPE